MAIEAILPFSLKVSSMQETGGWFTVVLTTLLNYTLRSAFEDSIGGITDG